MEVKSIHYLNFNYECMAYFNKGGDFTLFLHFGFSRDNLLETFECFSIKHHLWLKNFYCTFLYKNSHHYPEKDECVPRTYVLLTELTICINILYAICNNADLRCAIYF